MRYRILLILISAFLFAVPVSTQQMWSPPPEERGVFAVTERGLLKLRTYAEPGHGWPWLTFAQGGFEDVPEVAEVRSFITNMLGWSPRSVVIGSDQAFQQPYPELRFLVLVEMSLSVLAKEVRAVDLKQPRLSQLFRQVGSDERGTDAYVFLVAAEQHGAAARWYPVRITLAGNSRDAH